MILPTKGIPPQRSLLAVGAQILLALDGPMTVTQVWTTFRQWRDAHDHRAPIPFWWFVLALDCLYALGTVDMQDGLLVKRRADATTAQRI